MATNRMEIGIKAENEMVEEIKRMLSVQSIYDYSIIQDVCYRSTVRGVRKYSQIDAVLVCTLGVFCIEFKKWKGTVYPTENAKWLVKSPNGGSRYFDNSVIQNAKHNLMLNKLCERNVEGYMENVASRSVIVFHDSTNIASSDYNNIINCNQFMSWVMSNYWMMTPELVKKTSKFVKRLSDVNKVMFYKEKGLNYKSTRFSQESIYG